jgi:toxin ParE1/3/4
LIDKLHSTLQALATQPGMGRRRDELAPGLQSFPLGRYVIFYRALPAATEIVRVLHGARDVESIL